MIAQRLQLATGFLSSERDWIVQRLAALGSRLRSFPDTQIDLEISFKERHGAGQRVTLECWINRTPRLHLVSTSSARELAMAVGEVRDDLIRQVDDAKPAPNPTATTHGDPRRSARGLRVSQSDQHPSVPHRPAADQALTQLAIESVMSRIHTKRHKHQAASRRRRPDQNM